MKRVKKQDEPQANQIKKIIDFLFLLLLLKR